jgi:hypothetical protein
MPRPRLSLLLGLHSRKSIFVHSAGCLARNPCLQLLGRFLGLFIERNTVQPDPDYLSIIRAEG